MSLLAVSFSSCGGEKKRPVYEDVSEVAEEPAYAQSGDEVVVPFRSEGGVKLVPVEVNGVGFEMIFDTGCSTTLISIAKANYLYQKGKLKQEDILGRTQSQIADGSIVENGVVNLEEVVIDGKIYCQDVQAVVSGNINAPLLLGNEVLDRIAIISIDNENGTLNFKLK